MYEISQNNRKSGMVGTLTKIKIVTSTKMRTSPQTIVTDSKCLSMW